MSLGPTRFCRVGMVPPYAAARSRSNGSRSGPRSGRRHALPPSKLLEDGPPSPLIADALRGQHQAGDPFFFAQEPEQQVLRPDVVLSEVARFTEGQLERLLGTRGERHMTGPQALAPSPKPGSSGTGCAVELSRTEGLPHRAADV